MNKIANEYNQLMSEFHKPVDLQKIATERIMRQIQEELERATDNLLQRSWSMSDLSERVESATAHIIDNNRFLGIDTRVDNVTFDEGTGDATINITMDLPTTVSHIVMNTTLVP